MTKQLEGSGRGPYIIIDAPGPLRGMGYYLDEIFSMKPAQRDAVLVLARLTDEQLRRYEDSIPPHIRKEIISQINEREKYGPRGKPKDLVDSASNN